jgi:bile acid-coenzyme A ligase
VARTEAEKYVEAELSFVRRIGEMAAEHPDQVAVRVIKRDGTEPAMTWAELHERSSQVAAAMAARGLSYGDRLAIGLVNSPQLMVSTFAAWKLGAVPVPVRWDIPDWELERIKAVIEPRIFIGPEDLEWIDATATDPVPEFAEVISPQTNGICSSGSTGTPKVIIADRKPIFMDAMAIPMMEQFRHIPRPQVILVPTQMYHTNGFATFFNLLGGDELILMEKFDAARVVDVIEHYHVSNFTATPTMLQRIADLPGIDDRDLSSIQWFIQGAAPMPPALVHRWADMIGADRILMAYGMTEGLGLTALTAVEWMEHQGTVGRGIRGTELRILDEDQKELAPGEIGDIYLRSMALGADYEYLGNAPRLRSTPDGFQTAGDMGYLDDDGYLFLVDRRVDMIITGGANVFPAEVEYAIIEHPAIADVVVIGLQDPAWGRRVHAIVQPAEHATAPTEAEVIAYAKTRLASYKVPKTIEFVDEIPRSAATKVNRGLLVEARGG